MAVQIFYIRLTVKPTEIERVRLTDPQEREKFETNMEKRLTHEATELDWILAQGFQILATQTVEDWRGTSVAFILHRKSTRQEAWDKRYVEHLTGDKGNDAEP